MGTRLRNLKKCTNKNDLEDKKSLGGKGRLTEKEINKIQNYYGIAICQSFDNLYQMRKNTLAGLHHSCVADLSDARHILCPKTKDSWCKYQRLKLQIKDSKEKPGLPDAIKTFVKPIFNDLMSEDLLSKCLHGSTQNNNESLNALVWKRCPKDVFVGIDVLNLGCCSAIINFNDGLNGINKIFEKLYLKPGHYSSSFLALSDLKRVRNMEKKCNEKSRGKQLRSIHKGFLDKDEEEESLCYGAGEF